MTGRSSRRRGIRSSRGPSRDSAAIARTTSRPAMPSGERSSWPSGSRSSARRGRGSWRACSPGTGSARTRPSASCRWRRPTRVRDVLAALERAVRYGAFSLRRSRASSRRGAGPRRRWTRWPTTIGPTWTGSSTESRHRRDPPPTIKPCWARTLTMPKRPTPEPRPSHPPRNRDGQDGGVPEPPW